MTTTAPNVDRDRPSSDPDLALQMPGRLVRTTGRHPPDDQVHERAVAQEAGSAGEARKVADSVSGPGTPAANGARQMPG